MKIFLALIGFAYIIINIYVTIKINKALYLRKEMKKSHKIFIWIFPFFGPLIIKSYWRKQKDKKLEINTKDKRNIDNSTYYESEKGFYL